MYQFVVYLYVYQFVELSMYLFVVYLERREVEDVDGSGRGPCCHLVVNPEVKLDTGHHVTVRLKHNTSKVIITF
jgi:hypothetical protein